MSNQPESLNLSDFFNFESNNKYYFLSNATQIAYKNGIYQELCLGVESHCWNAYKPIKLWGFQNQYDQVHSSDGLQMDLGFIDQLQWRCEPIQPFDSNLPLNEQYFRLVNKNSGLFLGVTDPQFKNGGYPSLLNTDNRYYPNHTEWSIAYTNRNQVPLSQWSANNDLNEWYVEIIIINKDLDRNGNRLQLYVPDLAPGKAPKLKVFKTPSTASHMDSNRDYFLLKKATELNTRINVGPTDNLFQNSIGAGEYALTIAQTMAGDLPYGSTIRAVMGIGFDMFGSGSDPLKELFDALRIEIKALVENAITDNEINKMESQLRSLESELMMFYEQYSGVLDLPDNPEELEHIYDEMIHPIERDLINGINQLYGHDIFAIMHFHLYVSNWIVIAQLKYYLKVENSGVLSGNIRFLEAQISNSKDIENRLIRSRSSAITFGKSGGHRPHDVIHDSVKNNTAQKSFVWPHTFQEITKSEAIGPSLQSDFGFPTETRGEWSKILNDWKVILDASE